MNATITNYEYNAIRNALNKYKDDLNSACHKAHEGGAFGYAHDMKLQCKAVEQCLKIISEVHMRYE